MGFYSSLLLAAACILVLIAAVRLAHPLPSLSKRVDSLPPSSSVETLLDKSISQQVAEHPGASGVHIVGMGHEAFGVRRHLASIASRSIDAQYYIWNGDLTGQLLLHDVLAAADRGVRVRLLIDDNPTIGLDRMWSAVNAHANVELRLFNPFTVRWPRSLNYITDFARLNRRMHNKSFTIDGQVSVIGGRNIGDEYFDAAETVQFSDMDVLAVGPVVTDVSQDFERYWRSASAFPAELIVKAQSEAALGRMLLGLQQLADSERAKAYGDHTAENSLVRSLINRSIALEWAPVELISDDPAKGKGQIPRRKLVISGLVPALGQAQRSLEVASAYFVPGRFGGGYLRRLARSGVDVRVLTNSLASTDVAAVHAGYAKYRRRLLRAKVRLYEMKPLAAQGADNGETDARFLRLGSSKSSLHAKLFIIDRKSLFVGSFNFDPRSVYLNCEMGLLIHSEKLGQQVGAQFDRLAHQASFEPRLGRLGRLRWYDQTSDSPVAIEKEPESTFTQRTIVRVVGLLPVEWLL